MAEYGNADIAISPSSASESRFMFSEDAYEVLGEDIKAVGYYNTVLSVDGKVAFCAAADLLRIGDIFDFEFTDHREIDSYSLGSAAIVSSRFAQEHSLSVGDVFCAGMLGEEINYTVYAISEKPPIGDLDVLVDISTLVRVLSSDSPFSSMLGENFKPISILLIDLPDGKDASEAIKLLKSSESFADKDFTDVKNEAVTSGVVNNLRFIVNYVIALVVFLAGAVAFCCFFILSAQRSEENESFILAGAKPSLMHFMQYAEMLVFWAVGIIPGILLSFPLLSFAENKIGFVYAEMEPDTHNIVLSCLLLLLAMLLTVTVFILGRRGRHFGIGRPKAFVAFVIALDILAYIPVFTLPREYRLIAGIVAMLTVLISLFLISPILLRFVVRRLDEWLSGRLKRTGEARHPSLRYALKNIYSVRALHNVSRLLSLLLAVVLATVLLIGSTSGTVRQSKGMFEGDQVVMNGSERCYDKILATESIEGAERIYMGRGIFENDMSTNLVSVEELSVLSKNYPVTAKPRGNEAIISLGEAKMLSVDVGDSLRVELGGEVIELYVIEIVKSALDIVLFDSEHFGIERNIILTDLADGVSAEQGMLDVSGAVADEIAVVAESEEFTSSVFSSFDIYINGSELILLIVIVFSLIGMGDTLLESYSSRKGEFLLYENAGMSKRSVLSMKLFEMGFVLIFSLIVAFAFFLLLVPVLCEGFYSAGFDVLRGFFG